MLLTSFHSIFQINHLPFERPQGCIVVWLVYHLVYRSYGLVSPGRMLVLVHWVGQNVRNIGRHACRCRRPWLDRYRRSPVHTRHSLVDSRWQQFSLPDQPLSHNAPNLPPVRESTKDSLHLTEIPKRQLTFLSEIIIWSLRFGKCFSLLNRIHFYKSWPLSFA